MCSSIEPLFVYRSIWRSLKHYRTLCIYSLAGLFICWTTVCFQEHMKESWTLQNPMHLFSSRSVHSLNHCLFTGAYEGVWDTCSATEPRHQLLRLPVAEEPRRGLQGAAERRAHLSPLGGLAHHRQANARTGTSCWHRGQATASNWGRLPAIGSQNFIAR